MATTTIPYLKPPRSPAFLCGKLVDQGLIIEKIAEAEKVLQRCSYFRFKGYLHPFKDPDTKMFHPGTSFENALDLYMFDSELRAILFKVTERIEIGIRCALDSWITDETGNAFWYLDSSLFKTNGKYAETVSKLRGQFKATRKDNQATTHFKGKYHNDFCPFYRDLPPAWNAFELISIGGIYSLMIGLDNEKSVQDLKLKRFSEKRLGINKFEHACHWLDCIRQVRNICAHHGRLFNRNLPAPSAIKSFLNPEVTLVKTDAGQDQLNRLYCSVSAMQVISNTLGYTEYIGTEISDLFEKYPIANLFMASMGFPEDWKKERLILLPEDTVSTS